MQNTGNFRPHITASVKCGAIEQRLQMVTVGGDLQPGLLADWLVAGLGQAEINILCVEGNDKQPDNSLMQHKSLRLKEYPGRKF
eukprot:489431-Pelagomonas_calceolata.AAC.1